MRPLVLAATVALVASSAACGDPFALGPATIENRVDTLKLYAVNGTPLTQPSAYLLATKSSYRLGVDLLPYNFDFLYRVDAARGPELVPYSAVAAQSGASGRSGFLRATEGFEAIAEAQQSGYVTDSTAAVGPGDVFYLRSGLPNGCFLLIPYYAKLEVLSIDAAERSIRFRILVNNNCGYRGLAPGIPAK
jgi:hypothetical protein